ncbi:hypothetical protein KFE25_012483 [Diacronema lutheri]|uniref:Fucosyltransferase n=2 Tax=Diacronema lutheri TaxID=2081491 RepID=A0A8J5XLW9_DIALT|nr:hypothetical protein KFE25_012483 [Diacronema lutheri]
MANPVRWALIALALGAVALIGRGLAAGWVVIRQLALERVNFPARSSREILAVTAARAAGVSHRGARLIAAHAAALRATMNATTWAEERTVVLVWDTMRLYGTWWEPPRPGWLAPCNVQCEWTADRARLGEADAIAFTLDAPVPAEMLAARRAGQRTIGVSLENLQQHDRFHALAIQLRSVDMLITYELDAHVPRPYFEPGYFEPRGLRGLKRPKPKVHGAAVAAFISNCERQGALSRLDLLAELSAHVRVDHYGRCGHNTDLPHTRGAADWGAKKLGVVGKYRFLSAMENSLALDYVSEKVYHALLVGTIPIYLGAPNVFDFLPCDAAQPCIVHVADYLDARGRLDARRLGAHLNHLASNETAFAQYLRWRDGPLPQRFVDLAELGRHAASCRACHCLRGRLGCAESPEGR